MNEQRVHQEWTHCLKGMRLFLYEVIERARVAVIRQSHDRDLLQTVEVCKRHHCVGRKTRNQAYTRAFESTNDFAVLAVPHQ
jgi:hypothetical protein